MKYATHLFLISCLALVTISCGDDDDAAATADVVSIENKPVELTGAVAGTGAKKGVTQAIGDALGGVAQSGASSNASSNMVPPAEVFADDSSAATAPAYTAMDGDTAVVLTAWEGPLEGPDGESGWYRRTWSYTYADPNTTSARDVTDVYSYWFRTEPESNFVDGGWANVNASVIHYGWTAESSIWSGSSWLMDIHFVQPTQNTAGETVPAALTGTWKWWVDADAAHYANTLGTGVFRYGFSNQEDGLRGLQDALQGEALLAMAVGDTFEYQSDVTASWEFDILVYGYDNEEAIDIFGGGAGTFDLALAVTRESETSFYLGFAFAGSATGYVGTGDLATGVNYYEEPAFAEDVTPPGDLWGSGYGNDDLGADTAPQDGLIYWYTYTYDWDTSARTGISENTSTYYSKTLSLTYKGSRYENVSCSAPDVATDCPADSGQ